MPIFPLFIFISSFPPRCLLIILQIIIPSSNSCFLSSQVPLVFFLFKQLHLNRTQFQHLYSCVIIASQDDENKKETKTIFFYSLESKLCFLNKSNHFAVLTPI